MRLERRGLLPWLILSSAVLCLWCSFLSAAGGWLAGSDIAAREARAGFAATAAVEQQALPELGVLVTRLDRTGPAAAAGLQRGDLIVAINGAHVQDARDLRAQLLSYQVGDTVRLTLLREQGEEDVAVRLAPSPADARRPYLGVYYTARGEEPADL
ncbi:MAG TPA: PDZ domain-containing protein [Roseiflexaceae bacterium]|nr:PDZ domain-containing protein [Roseiflexaceae bacterium]